jgi:RNA recognition motif-containing protein
MSTVLIDGLDSRTTGDLVKNFCQSFGRILNCYVKSSQCIVTFAEHQHAEEFIRASPHRIDSNGLVTASWKAALPRNAPSYQRPTNKSNDHCRLTVRGTFDQLDENTLLRYFSSYGQIRMCLPNPSQGYATITFDDRMGCERVLKEPRHFLNGRSLVVEPYTSPDEFEPSKRMKVAEHNDSTISAFNLRFDQEKEQWASEQARLQNQFQERLQWCEYEKQQLSSLLSKQHAEFSQQIVHCQYLLQQSVDEIIKKDKQIEQLRQDNKDIEYEFVELVLISIELHLVISFGRACTIMNNNRSMPNDARKFIAKPSANTKNCTKRT